MHNYVISGIVTIGFMAVGAAMPSLAQTAQFAAVGSVVHNADGSSLGTIVHFADGGRTAVVETPAHFFPGSRLVGSDQFRIPTASLADASSGHAARLVASVVHGSEVRAH
ncbi:MAG: hypothetical protein PVSMB10_16930 [Pseudarthrobacter sp.]